MADDDTIAITLAMPSKGKGKKKTKYKTINTISATFLVIADFSYRTTGTAGGRS